MRERTFGRILAIGLIIGGVYFLALPQQKSNFVRLSECTKTAGEIHDSSRKTITINASGYSKDEQASYYMATENGYKHDLETCRDLYGR